MLTGSGIPLAIRKIAGAMAVLVTVQASHAAEAPRPELVVQGGSSEDLSTLRFSKDDQTVVAGSREGEIYVWDVASNLLLWKGGRQSGRVIDAVISDDRSALYALSSQQVEVADDSYEDLAEVSHWALGTSVRNDLISDDRQFDEPTSLALSPGGDWLQVAGTGMRSFVVRRSLAPSGEMAMLVSSANADAVASAAGDGAYPEGQAGDGRLIAVRMGYEGPGLLWDLEQGRELVTYDPKPKAAEDGEQDGSAGGEVKFLAAADDASLVLGRDGDFALVIVDGKTGAPVFHDGNADVYDEPVAVSRDGAYAAYLQQTGDRRNELDRIAIWSRAAGRVVRVIERHYGEDDMRGYHVGALAFSSDGRRLAIADTEVTIWNPETGLLEQTLTARRSEAHIAAATLSDDRRMLVIAGEKSGRPLLQTIDLFDGTVTNLGGHAAPVAGAVTFGSGAGERIVSVGRDNTVLMHDLHTGMELSRLALPYERPYGSPPVPTSLVASPSGKWIAMSQTSPGDLVLMSVDDAGLKVACDGFGSSEAGAPVARFVGEDRLLIGRANSGVQKTYDAAPWDLHAETFAADYDLARRGEDGCVRASRFLAREVYSRTEVRGLVERPDGTDLVAVHYKGALSSGALSTQLIEWRGEDYTLPSGRKDHTLDDLVGKDGIASLDQAADGALLIGLQSGVGAVVYQSPDGAAQRIATGGDEVLSAQFLDGPDRFVTVHRDGRVSVWKAGRDMPAFTFFSVGAQDDYLLAMPDGHYRSTKGQVNEIAFRQATDIFPFHQFDLQLNRPDIVQAAIGAAVDVNDAKALDRYRQATQQRYAQMGMAVPAADVLPRLSPAPALAVPLPALTSQAAVRVAVSGNGDRRVRVTVNGVPAVMEGQGAAFDVAIAPGVNTLRISTLDASGHASLERVARVERTDAPRRTMHVVAIGVSHYANSAYNLKYAAKDARELAAALAGSKGGGQFDEVRSLVITDNKAKRGLTEEVAGFLSGAKVQDTVVLFFAGHGVIAADKTYVLGTHDTDFADPGRTGLAFDDLVKVFEGTSALNRLMLVDACHSGELEPASATMAQGSGEGERGQVAVRVPKGARATMLGGRAPVRNDAFRDMKTLFADLRSQGGATVIASSSASEFSFEGPQWNNGVFTHALKQALASNVADADRDGVLRVSELRNYTESEVAKLTHGAQRPIVRMENTENDFVLAPVIDVAAATH